MIPKRWHHGHSLGAGVLVGLALTYRPWLLFVIGLLLGAILVVLAIGGYRLGRTLLAAFEAWRDRSRAKREEIRTTPSPIYGGRKRGRR